MDKDGKYLGYEFQYEYGNMGMLYVTPEARGQGLGSYITCQLAEKILKPDESVWVTVETFNDKSFKLHENLGFKKICLLEYLFHKSNLVTIGEL